MWLLPIGAAQDSLKREKSVTKTFEKSQFCVKVNWSVILHLNRKVLYVNIWLTYLVLRIKEVNSAIGNKSACGVLLSNDALNIAQRFSGFLFWAVQIVPPKILENLMIEINEILWK